MFLTVFLTVSIETSDKNTVWTLGIASVSVATVCNINLIVNELQENTVNSELTLLTSILKSV